MSTVVVGLSHKTAPIALLERLAISEDRLAKSLHQLSTFEHVMEAAVLSTCNRIEVYARVTKFHAGVQDLRNFLAEFCHVAPEEFTDHLYTYHDDAAIRHLFRVAGGIDSMILGESEILGQVRRAFQAAHDEGLVQRMLGRAFSQALHVGKRVRTETEIGRNPVSISSAAVALARRAFGDRDLSERSVLIVGAGKMGRLAVQALAGAGARDVTVVNRTEEKAHLVAQRFGVIPRPLTELDRAMAHADIVISSTTAPQAVIDRTIAARALDLREGRAPLFIVDIAVPRDVDRDVARLDGVILRDLEDLRGVVESNLGTRLAEVGKVEAIIDDEVERFGRWERASDIAPTISALLARAEQIRASELERMNLRSKDLTVQQRQALDEATKKMIAKLLHEPLSQAKELASSKQGQLYLAAVRELFELDDERP